MDITIFLTDTADGYSTVRDFIFREWDGTRANAEARMASAGEDGTITLTFTDDPREVTADTLERVYAATNGMPNLIDVAARDAYYANEVRSLSVGDIVHIPGKGLFAVANAGFAKMHLFLPSDDQHDCEAEECCVCGECQEYGEFCTGHKVERNLDGDDATRTCEHIELPADSPVTCACDDCVREHAAVPTRCALSRSRPSGRLSSFSTRCVR